MDHNCGLHKLHIFLPGKLLKPLNKTPSSSCSFPNIVATNKNTVILDSNWCLEKLHIFLPWFSLSILHTAVRQFDHSSYFPAREDRSVQSFGLSEPTDSSSLLHSRTATRTHIHKHTLLISFCLKSLVWFRKYIFNLGTFVILYKRTSTRYNF